MAKKTGSTHTNDSEPLIDLQQIVCSPVTVVSTHVEVVAESGVDQSTIAEMVERQLDALPAEGYDASATQPVVFVAEHTLAKVVGRLAVDADAWPALLEG